MTSMHRPAERSHVPLHLGVVVLAAQPAKDIHNRTLGGIDKYPLGYIRCAVQQLFGFGDFFHAASLRGSACNRTQLFLNKVVFT